MTIYAKVSGAWKHTARIFAKVSNAWKRVNAAYTKQGGVWKQVYGRPFIQLYSLGLSETVIALNYSGLWKNTLHQFTISRGWTIITFDKYGNTMNHQTFDLFGEVQEGTATGQIDAFTNALNALPNDQLFALLTYDEPKAGHLSNSLPTAAYRVGCTAGIYGQPMSYRSAYMLLGKVGSPASYEGYAGNIDSDPNSAVIKSAYIFENNWTNIS